MTEGAKPTAPQPGPTRRKAVPVWQQIHESLLHDISEGRYNAGQKLPTEAELSARFGVNRHTVRRALGALQEAGLVTARRGAGVFVSHSQVPYPIGRKTRLSQNLAALGLTGTRTLHRLETLPSGAAEAEALGLLAGAPVHIAEATFSANGAPLVTGHSVFPGERFPDLPQHLAALTSITEALSRAGLDDYRRQSTRVTAETANGALARHLAVSEGAPLIRTRAINVDPTGQPVEYGTSWFAADRVELVVEGD